jgi:hypothetical protein
MAGQKPASDGTTPTQDAPPQDEKAPKVEDTDITGQKGALAAVRPTGPVEPLDAEANYVQYKGRGQMRRITEAQWRQARVEDQGEIVWDKANNFKVPLSDFNDQALLALARDGSFALPDRS